MGTLLSCTAENGGRWHQEVYNLVLSVRTFGGGISDAPIVACFVDDVDPRYVEGLAELDAEVRVVERFDSRNPPSNKLRMLDLVDDHDFDTLALIDTDTIVFGDVGQYAAVDAVAVKPENDDPYSLGCWRRIYAAMDIPEPSRSMITTATGKPTFPYYNSGVLFVPRVRCAELAEAWARRVYAALDLYVQQPDVVPGPAQHWTNQLALALALTETGMPVAPLPVAANLSTTGTVHPLYAHQVTPPFVLHYHNEMDESGFVYESRNPVLNPLIDTFNRALAETTGRPYEELPRPPLARRAVRWTGNHGWYRHGPLAWMRRRRIFAPVRRRVKDLARGTPSSTAGRGVR